MIFFVQFWGVVMMILILIGTASFIAGSLKEWYRTPDKWSWNEGQNDYRNQLKSYAWWFSEDEATMKLIQDLSTNEDVNTIRERWHKARSAGNTKASG